MQLVNIIPVTKNKKRFTANDSTEQRRLENYETLSDAELNELASAGDEQAFAEIVRRYSPRVFRFAERFFRRRSLVEEAAQEVFLKIFTQLKSYEGRGSFEGWLTRITINTCINILRGAKRETELTESALSDDETDWLERQMSNQAAIQHKNAEEKTVATDLVNRVLEKMSPEDRLVLTMIDGEGHSIKDLVEITGWSESKVKVQAFRARRRMREAVEKLLVNSTETKVFTK